MRKIKQPYIFALIWVLSILAIGSATARNTSENNEKTSERLKTAIFAGGCFWCMEHAFDEVAGVISTISGYTGGHVKDPRYKDVSMGKTGHAEAVKIVYDSSQINYEQLLDVFWHNIDPTVRNRQFCDRGSQYRSEIFYLTERQKALATVSINRLALNKPFEEAIVTEITQASQFYPAEEFHQDYHLKNPIRYKVYRFGCGRDQRLAALWGKKHLREG